MNSSAKHHELDEKGNLVRVMDVAKYCQMVPNDSIRYTYVLNVF